jgi:prepilin-type N-terminal cleavage/methylation domain-containing protein
MKTNTRRKNCFVREGFTLVELIISILIFSIILVAIAAVFVSTLHSYQKAKAVKSLKESSEYALSLIAKDVRMGKIEKSSSYSNGSKKNTFMVTRNRNQVKVCYVFSADNTKLSVLENTTNCSDGTEQVLVDLSGTGMTFKLGAGFYSCPSAESVTDLGYYACPSSAELRRGWVEINLDIGDPSMETDEIKVQTIVSSRDYGWGEV